MSTRPDMTELHQLASEPPPAPAARSAIRSALGWLAAHATARAATARRALERREARRVWLFIAVLGVMATGAMVAYVAPITDAARPIGLPWPLLALGFLAAESKVIVVHFRRETHSFSLSEVPAVLGLFFLSPTDYLLASLVGSGAALIAARQSVVKLTFNLANFAAIAVLQLVIFHAIGRFDAVPTPVDWLAAFAAMVAGSVFSVFTIATAISLSGGAPQFQKLPEMIRFGSLVALANTSLALLAVTVMWIEPSAAWLLVIPLGALYLAYRAYVSEREKHERLELLYESSRILQHSPELDSALVALLDHARGMFRSELAEIILYPRAAGGDALRTTSLHEGPAGVMLPEPDGLYAAVRARLEAEPGARFQDAADGSSWSGPPLRQAMLSPLVGDSGQIGLMRVANRLTAGTGFEEDDLRLLETLSNQAAVALENGQLEQSLAELSRLKEELRYQAYHDPLTGLANRVMFAEQVERRLAGLRPGAVTAVLFLDLDDFKLVNDTLGHAAGDRLLAGVGERIRGCIRADDVAARLGGDEFGILLVDDVGLGRAKAVAARIIETLQAPFPLHGRELVIGGSLGIAVGHRAGERADDLLRNADVAMYTAKAGGKGRVAIFDPRMHAALIARHELSAQLSRSVGRGELVVYYQPIVELATGRPTAVEALVRWRHPTRGLVAPDEFIPLAEENGTILALGRWVLAEACRQAADWIRTSDLEPGFSISVNLSSLQLQQPDFIDEIERVLALTGLPPDRLILELTETAMFGDTEGAIVKLTALRARGVRIAVDDFGTGYSSLGYLRRFPVDILKIAREFVVPADRDAEEWAFAHAILALGRTLGLRIVAEGIEERAQADRLMELGCEFGQGYQFGRPEPAERIVEIARAGREIVGRARPAGLRTGEAGA
ncbi:MAG TPA: EAL domain-containing protein [Candidatus Limnocylindrales bacterium]|nr:EAL domain-containing protein [Candidatus Limnocylindrales bacterium]